MSTISNTQAGPDAGRQPSPFDITEVITCAAIQLAQRICPGCNRPTIHYNFHQSRPHYIGCASCGFVVSNGGPALDTGPANFAQGPIQQVTQAQLVELLMLRFQGRREQMLRTELLRLISQGAPVEPGCLRLALHNTETRRITNRLIEQLFGREALLQLQERIEPTRSQSLHILQP